MTEKGWSATRYTGPPMTLGNMRANGVRRVDVSCWECRVLDVDQDGDEVPVLSSGSRMVPILLLSRFASPACEDVPPRRFQLFECFAAAISLTFAETFDT